jgi:hypothetical protein
MTSPNPNLASALVLGAAVGIVTAVTGPQYVGGSLAFAGGLIGGASLVSERNQKKLKEQETAVRVTSCFSSLYESNRGIIDPVQLAFLSNVSLDKAHTFLTSLAENNNGQKVSVKTGVGVVFAFPHTQAALDELTTNAKKWAEAQTQQMAAELNEHKRAIQYLQLQQASKAAAPKVADEPSPWENVKPSI